MKIFIILGISLSIFLLPILSYADSLILSPVDFLPALSGTEYEAGNSSLVVKPASPFTGFWAPVHLPDGAKITSVVVFYRDSSAVGNMLVSLFKCNIYTESQDIMASWISSSDSLAYQNHKISPITGNNSVNNNGYCYMVLCSFTDASVGNQVKLHKVKILYQ